MGGSRAWLCGVVWLVGLLAVPVQALGQATDAISREVSVFNDLTPAFPLDTVSREITVFNDLAVTEAVDSVSREVAVLVFQQRVSSNLPAMALPVEAVLPGAVLPDQLALLNDLPPATVDPNAWQPVQRQDIDFGEAFECAAVPDPLGHGFVVADQYIPGVDEVTLDGCSSAWYRFEFFIPPTAFDLKLEIIANVDDQGVAWLNGRQLTGTMTVPPCVPFGGPTDPCYDEQDTGHDRTDAEGRAILTAPTAEVFAVEDPNAFVPGATNELVFSVAGDASFFDPTGVEFDGVLIYQRRPAGDINGDCTVDLNDLATLLSNFGLTGLGFEDGDTDLDGDVDLSDLSILLSTFGASCP